MHPNRSLGKWKWNPQY